MSFWNRWARRPDIGAMPNTFDLPDIKARLLSQPLSYDARCDVLRLVGLIEEIRSASTRHFHAIEEIADAMAEENLEVWANSLLDEATTMYEDLHPKSPYERPVEHAIFVHRAARQVIGYA